MGRRKLEERNIRKLTKTGGDKSYSVTLPIAGVRFFGWKDRQKVVIKIDKKRKRFIVEDWRK